MKNSDIRIFQGKAPVDVVSYARTLGINVWESEDELQPSSPGLIRKDSKHGGQAGYSIIVRGTDPYTKKRFTVATLVSHFLHHTDAIENELNLDALYKSRLTLRADRDAILTASDILMPTSLIQFLSGKHGPTNTKAIAEELEVTETALKIRMGLD